MRGIGRDEQRRIRPKPPPARRVAAARRHVLRCRSSEMAPHRLRRGALNLAPWRSQRGPSQIDSHPLSTLPCSGSGKRLFERACRGC